MKLKSLFKFCLQAFGEQLNMLQKYRFGGGFNAWIHRV
jgi:hypothetical protein